MTISSWKLVPWWKEVVRRGRFLLFPSATGHHWICTYARTKKRQIKYGIRAQVGHHDLASPMKAAQRTGERRGPNSLIQYANRGFHLLIVAVTSIRQATQSFFYLIDFRCALTAFSLPSLNKGLAATRLLYAAKCVSTFHRISNGASKRERCFRKKDSAFF
jgi:hypothetical protein